MSNIELGKKQKLTILRKTDFGVYLGLDEGTSSVLLPKKQVPEKAMIGDSIEVFVYKDSEDRLISTVNEPLVKLGEFASLKVKSVARVGAFLDWGLEKDLFLPYKEQEGSVYPGDQVAVYVYTDKSGRLSATMKLYDHLAPAEQGEFKEEDLFTGFVYRYTKGIGAFIAVIPKAESAEKTAYERLIFGLVPDSQVFSYFKAGERISGRIVRVRKDGKLDVSDRKRDYQQLDADGERILKKLREYDGTLPFSDNASPEVIRRELGMSKNGFKKALGHLYKAGRVQIYENTVEFIK